MADQNLQLVCRPLVAMEWAEKGLEVLDVLDVLEDESCICWPSTSLPIPGTGGEALR